MAWVKTHANGFPTSTARRVDSPSWLSALVSGLKRLPSDSGRRIEQYRPFPNMEGKNRRQASVEIPLFDWALGLPRGVRVLEVGCGRGVGLVGLQHRLHPTRLVGLDIDRDLLTAADGLLLDRGVAAELFWGDVRRMPFADEAFDLVVDFGTCYHISYAERALSEIERVLAPGGMFAHETVLAQLTSHPIRSLGRGMPWSSVSGFARCRWRGLWASKRKIS